MERCPVCKARFKDDTVCYRCGTDLSTLLRIERQAELLEQQAVAFYGAGHLSEAHRVAEQALALMRSPLRCRLVEFLAWEAQNPLMGSSQYNQIGLMGTLNDPAAAIPLNPLADLG